jgi:rubrerythrin
MRMSQRWSLDSINWFAFDASKVDAQLLALVKTASLVEANAADYVIYLRNIFAGDADFIAQIEQWGVEERLHGEALGRWAETADPTFSFEKALADFRAGYHFKLNTSESVRGSRGAELIARQVVETGTSSFYSAIRDAAYEPVLKDIAARIASDEYFHYQLFRKNFARLSSAKPMSIWSKLKVAITRFREAEDDELGYAYFAANILAQDRSANYQARNYAEDYWRISMALYRRPHIDAGVRMILRAVDMPSNGWIYRRTSALLWWATKRHGHSKMRMTDLL